MKYCQIGLLREHHPPDRQILSSLQPIQLDPARNAATDCVPPLPDKAVAAGRLTVVDQSTDLLAEDIVDHEPNILLDHKCFLDIDLAGRRGLT